MLGPSKRYIVLAVSPDGHRRVTRAETATEAVKFADREESEGRKVYVSFPDDGVELPLKQFKISIHGIGIKDT